MVPFVLCHSMKQRSTLAPWLDGDVALQPGQVTPLEVISRSHKGTCMSPSPPPLCETNKTLLVHPSPMEVLQGKMVTSHICVIFTFFSTTVLMLSEDPDHGYSRSHLLYFFSRIKTTKREMEGKGKKGLV